MKQLKPGQLCTIHGIIKGEWVGHVYRAKRKNNDVVHKTTCSQCAEINRKACILDYNGVIFPLIECRQRFGLFHHPVLVK